MLVAALLGIGVIRTSDELGDEVKGAAGTSTTWADLVDGFAALNSSSSRGPKTIGRFFRHLILQGYLDKQRILHAFLHVEEEKDRDLLGSLGIEA